MKYFFGSSLLNLNIYILTNQKVLTCTYQDSMDLKYWGTRAQYLALCEMGSLPTKGNLYLQLYSSVAVCGEKLTTLICALMLPMFSADRIRTFASYIILNSPTQTLSKSKWHRLHIAINKYYNNYIS